MRLISLPLESKIIVVGKPFTLYTLSKWLISFSLGFLVFLVRSNFTKRYLSFTTLSNFLVDKQFFYKRIQNPHQSEPVKRIKTFLLVFSACFKVDI